MRFNRRRDSAVPLRVWLHVECLHVCGVVALWCYHDVEIKVGLAAVQTESRYSGLCAEVTWPFPERSNTAAWEALGSDEYHAR